MEKRKELFSQKSISRENIPISKEWLKRVPERKRKQ
jgi:hypothetical protein